MATLIQILQFTLSQKSQELSNDTRRILLKEALQAFTLDFLYNHPEYRRLNFYGGTCLRLVYGLNRLSEDIDLDNLSKVPLSTLKQDLLDYFAHMFGYTEITGKEQLGEHGIFRITLKFPVLRELGLSAYPNEALHLKVEISQHDQIAVIQKTPILVFGRSFVPAHFSLETMMAGKMLACLERNFQRGKDGVFVKGRDFYDLLWFMQQNIRPLEEKLARDGNHSYTTASAMDLLDQKVRQIRPAELAEDLYPLFEQRTFIEAWVDSFHEIFTRLVRNYL